MSSIAYGGETGGKGGFVANGRLFDEQHSGEPPMTMFIIYTRGGGTNCIVQLETNW